MEKTNKVYLQSVDSSGSAENIFYKIESIESKYTNILEINNSTIIIYDTRISKNAIDKKFENAQMIKIEESIFEEKLREIIKKKDKK